MDYSGRVVIVTGAGGGLGKEYALLFAASGASVVVNDVGVGLKDDVASSRPADAVVEIIRSRGGKAVPNYDSVENGTAIIQTALDNFGKIDVVINNAGILRDKSFGRMTDEDWDSVQRVHLKGSYSVTRAAWDHMKKQNYGRIIVTASTAGIYGNFGQSSYAAAKMALIGFSNTLAIEGAKYNIHCNVIVPMAASRLTQDVLPPDIFEKLKPETVAPVVAWLCHEDCEENGGVFEAAGGLVSKYRWERSRGVVLEPITPDSVREQWTKITDFSSATYPTSNPELMAIMMNDLSAAKDSIPASTSPGQSETVKFTYTPKDAILYALSVGASVSDPESLKYVYEGHPDFCALPTFSILPAQNCLGVAGGSFLSAVDGMNVDLTKLLHGEQFVRQYRPLEPEDELTSSYKEVARLDKGSGALLVIDVETRSKDGELVALNQFCLFLVGEGGFGGPRTSDKIVPLAAQPDRDPDVILEFETCVDQAALYRLNGDVNPLHIDPDMAALAGFKSPILHGLCSLGIVSRQLLQRFRLLPNAFKSVKVRFNAPVVPNETLETRVWVEGNRLVFSTVVKGTKKVALSGGVMELDESVVKPEELLAIIGEYRTKLGTALTEGEGTDVSDIDQIFRRLEEEMNKQERKWTNELKAVIVWSLCEVLKDDAGEEWTLDVKSRPIRIYRGRPTGKKPDLVVKVTKKDFLAIASGKMSAQGAFLQRRLLLNGNMAIANKIQSILSDMKRERSKNAKQSRL